MKDLLEKQRETGRTPVVFIETELLESISRSSRKELYSKISEYNLKIYKTETAQHLLKYNKVCVVRYGYLSDAISARIRLKKGKVISGNL